MSADTTHDLGDRIFKSALTRRDFLWLMSISSVGTISGCAKNPVTGEKQLILMSESQEIEIDKSQSPHQFSADYGEVQDGNLNAYISSIGNKIAQSSHRPQMPYSFRGVNATTINAYAFPAGSIAVTRGIMLEMQNEAELAGLLGHEIGHVNARHSAQRQTKSMITGALLTGVSLYAGTTDYAEYAPLIQTLGAQAQGVLLAHYSRNNEREADSLGLEYMSKIGQNPQGMVGLMELLAKGSRSKPGALELMFATHPLSSERLQTARNKVASQYKKLDKIPLNRERYMDNTAKLRSMKPVLENVQKGEVLQNKEKFSQAEPYLKTALRHNPRDYASLLLMSKCQFGLNRKKTALRYAEQAKVIYPREAQAHHVAGVIKLAQKKPQSAYNEFTRSKRLLPGNPNTTFLQATSLEGMQNKKAAASMYKRYLSEVQQGGQAKHAIQRLKSWGYMK